MSAAGLSCLTRFLSVRLNHETSSEKLLLSVYYGILNIDENN